MSGTATPGRSAWLLACRPGSVNRRRRCAPARRSPETSRGNFMPRTGLRCAEGGSANLCWTFPPPAASSGQCRGTIPSIRRPMGANSLAIGRSVGAAGVGIRVSQAPHRGAVGTQNVNLGLLDHLESIGAARPGRIAISGHGEPLPVGRPGWPEVAASVVRDVIPRGRCASRRMPASAHRGKARLDRRRTDRRTAVRVRFRRDVRGRCPRNRFDRR